MKITVYKPEVFEFDTTELCNLVWEEYIEEHSDWKDNSIEYNLEEIWEDLEENIEWYLNKLKLLTDYVLNGNLWETIDLDDEREIENIFKSLLNGETNQGK